MTDREKLNIIKIECNATLGAELLCNEEIYKLTLEKILLIIDYDPYPYTGKPCYDKPAGTPIYHWETEK